MPSANIQIRHLLFLHIVIRLLFIKKHIPFQSALQPVLGPFHYNCCLEILDCTLGMQDRENFTITPPRLSNKAGATCFFHQFCSYWIYLLGMRSHTVGVVAAQNPASTPTSKKRKKKEEKKNQRKERLGLPKLVPRSEVNLPRLDPLRWMSCPLICLA